jgi:hypothetical protein
VALVVAQGACSSDPPVSPGDTPGWQTLVDDGSLGGAALAAWGTGPDDVYVVGGPLGNEGFEAVALHFDGAGWTRLAPGGADSFWWVNGTSATDVWMVGEKGRVTHWDGQSFVEHPRPTTATVWGVWAASPSDAWIVAGTPGGGLDAPNDLLFHWDGKAWTKEPLPGAPLGVSLTKIWGAGADDVYAIGEAATVWHRKGTSWTLESKPPVASSNLFSVSGCSATEVYAVGGSDLIRSDGTSWSKVEGLTIAGTADGVTCNAPGEVMIVGFGGMKQRLVDGKWINEFKSKPFDADFHGAWADGQGAFWALGGDFLGPPVSGGVARKATIGRWAARPIAPVAF